jgi:hypothetical protein
VAHREGDQLAGKAGCSEAQDGRETTRVAHLWEWEA